jgi:hypothetical protein
MSEIKSIKLANGRTIFVEMEKADVPKITKSHDADRYGLPEDAEAVGFKEDVADAIEALQDNIRELAESVHASLQSRQPDEWTLEMNIGFKGTTRPIPVILSGEASGGIKVTAKWKKAANAGGNNSGG